MKKLIIGLFLAAASLSTFTSCDMNLQEPGVETPDNVGNTVADLQKQLTYLYTQVRGITSGTYVTNTELQMDQFNGVEGNGGRGSQFALGLIDPANSYITGSYNACYGVMANINFFIEKADALKKNPELGESQIAKIEELEAQVKFIRAYFYFYLVDHFCPQYDGTNGDEPNSGVALISKYENSPSFNRDTYVGRSTLNQVLTLINGDLDEALASMLKQNNNSLSNCVPNAAYINTCTVLALQARVALYMGQYQIAMGKAQRVISNGNYRLCSIQNYPRMWTLDESSELIFVPAVPPSEYAYVGSINNAWNFYQSYPTFSDYIPSETTLYMYDDQTDVRYSCFFTQRSVQVSGSRYNVMQFTKFPGNEEIWGGTGTNYFSNKPKPFRLSEQYLILAESAANLGLVDEANNAIKALRENRIIGYAHEAIPAQDLLEEVQMERTKELLGEGFRMSDLRRWGLGFSRDGNYSMTPSFESQFIAAGLNVVYEANDHRYTWPIPADEMDVNPQMVQNRGYGSGNK